MNPFLISLVALAATAAHAATPPLPAFNSKSIALPPLSLRDITPGATAAQPSYHYFDRAPSDVVAARAPRKTARMTAMPILEPDATIDYKLIVRPPDTTIDFKLLVKEPETENAK